VKHRELFPGQVLRAEFNMEHAECLASSPRSEVFWAFSCDEPHSIAEVAAGIGKSPNSTTYHVHALVEVGLLIVAGERRRRSRTEKLYVHSARSFLNLGPTASKEYRQKSLEAFAAMARSMVRERETLNATYDFDTSMSSFSNYRVFVQRVSAERAKEFGDRVALLMREFAREAPDEDGVRLNIVFHMSPTVAESRRALAALKKKHTGQRES
jgi:hypothetical protein